MGARQAHIKRWIERLTGRHIERVGQRSYAFVDPASRTDAWCAPHWQMQRAMEDLRVDLVLDAGAHEGSFATRLRREYAGDLHSFEPVAATFARLRDAAAGDARWHLHQIALGRADTSAVIHVAANTVFSSLRPANAFSAKRFEKESAPVRDETVTVRRLDAVLRETVPDIGRRRVFLKTDTQGFDLEVFAGLGDLQSRVVLLLAEMSLIPIYDNMPHWTESLAEFERAGFSPIGMVPVTWDANRVIEYDCLMTRAAG